MTNTLLVLVSVLSLTVVGCAKKEDANGGGAAKAGGAAVTKSGLAWEPANYATMTEPCKKALACCEELAKAGGAASADDYNLKCSGPAMWKDDECTTDLASRITMLESESKPVPASCK